MSFTASWPAYFRHKRGMSQSQVAEAVSVTQAQVARWESRERRPRASNRTALAELFHTDEATLFPPEGSKQPMDVLGEWLDSRNGDGSAVGDDAPMMPAEDSQYADHLVAQDEERGAAYAAMEQRAIREAEESHGPPPAGFVVIGEDGRVIGGHVPVRLARTAPRPRGAGRPRRAKAKPAGASRSSSDDPGEPEPPSPTGRGVGS